MHAKIILSAPAYDRTEQDDTNVMIKLALSRDTILEGETTEFEYEEVEYVDEDGETHVETEVTEVITPLDNIFFDNTTLHINNSLTAGYDLGYDLEKMFDNTENATRPIFYSFSEVGKMALSAVPESEVAQPVRLGARYAEAGEHIISLTEIPEDAEEVVLHDALTGSYTNLMLGSYHFSVGAPATEENRFSIQVRMPHKDNTATGAEECVSTTTSTGVRVAAAGNMLVLSGLDGKAAIRMYDVTGRLVLVEQDVENGATLVMPATGVYVLSVETATQKDAIKMIINK